MAPISRPATMARTLSFPFRTRPQPCTSTPITTSFTLPLQQTRHESSNRRARKMDNIAPSAAQGGPLAPLGATGRSKTARTPIPASEHIIYNPPPSAPNVYHTPTKFLPKHDIRWKLHEAAEKRKADAINAALELAVAKNPNVKKRKLLPREAPLPPPINKPREKQYNISPEQIEEIRRLRTEDEDTWTIGKLSQKFQCSPQLIFKIKPASAERKGKIEAERADRLRRWRQNGVVSPRARAERVRRKELWGQEA